MFELFDHTADLGLRVRAAEPDLLFAEAGRAFLAVLVSNPDAVEPREVLKIDVAGRNLEYLFVDWLDELLFRFDSKRFLATGFNVRIDVRGLSATLHGEAYDSFRHRLAHEIKAVTYHELKVEQTEDGWLAEVILDI